MNSQAFTPDDVLDFWFVQTQPRQWWEVSAEFDALLAARFGTLLASARACELGGWRATPQGRLAEVIVLDQFSRNIHRGTPQAFAADPLALGLAQWAVAEGVDRGLEGDRLAFLYLPWMHSESRFIHETALSLFSAPGLERNLDFERRHKAIIDRFGRYPHRNAILGRDSSPEELEFLKTPGSAF